MNHNVRKKDWVVSEGVTLWFSGLVILGFPCNQFGYLRYRNCVCVCVCVCVACLCDVCGVVRFCFFCQLLVALVYEFYFVFNVI